MRWKTILGDLKDAEYSTLVSNKWNIAAFKEQVTPKSLIYFLLILLKTLD